MIFVDTNVVVRAFEGQRPADHNEATQRALDLLARVARGETVVSTSEAVIVEITRVLSSNTLYRQTPAEVEQFLAPLIEAPGLRLAPKLVYKRALRIWASRPTLGFVDALTVAYVEQGDVQLASFDRQLLASPGVTPYWPGPGTPG